MGEMNTDYQYEVASRQGDRTNRYTIRAIFLNYAKAATINTIFSI